MRYSTLWVLAVAISACAPRAETETEAGTEAESEAETGAQATALANRLTAEEVAAGWQLLFDGVSTDGWRGYGQEAFPESGWEVVGGDLVVYASDGSEQGLGGDIITEATFSDFELSFEFLVSPVGNSGLFYRVEEHEGEAMWQVAPEFQVLDDTAYIDMGTMDMRTHLTGDNYDLHASSVAASNPIGEWNHARIIVDGTHVEHWLNGRKTVEYELRSPEWEALVAQSKFASEEHYGRATSGHIGLQDHGHRIRYRNLKIRSF